MTSKVHNFRARVGGGYEISLFYPVSEQEFRGTTAEHEDRFTVRFVELPPATEMVEAVSFHSADPAALEIMMLVATFELAEGGTQVMSLRRYVE